MGTEKLENKWGRPPLDWGALDKKIRRQGLRNATTTCIAPTGTVSLIAACSSGIEPIFVAEGERSDGAGKRRIKHPALALFDELPKCFETAHQVSPSQHVRMQVAFQKFVQAAVSKTTNLHSEATEDDVRDVFLLAHKLGCKGITVYRDKSRREQVLSGERKRVRRRGRMVFGSTMKVAYNKRKLYVTLNRDEEGKDVEVFIIVGKSGEELSAISEMLGRLCSLALKFGVSQQVVYEAFIDNTDASMEVTELISEFLSNGADWVRVVAVTENLVNLLLGWGVEQKEIVKQLVGINSTLVDWHKGKRIDSLPDAIGKCLQELSGTPFIVVTACPECGGDLTYEESCKRCPSCGYSDCG